MNTFKKINTQLCKNTNHIRLSLLCFGHAMVDNKWQGKIYNPVHSRLYYVMNGNSTITTMSGRVVHLLKGNWYLIPSGCSFYYECENKMEHIYFHLKLHDVDGIDLLRKFNSPVSLNDTSDISDFLVHSIGSNEIYDSLKVYNDIYSVLLKIINNEQIVIKNKELSPCVERAIKYIRQNLSAQLTVDEVASIAFVSKSTLTKKFRQELSVSVANYIYDTIMFEAGQMLTQTTASVLSVSEKFCFSDQFYFSRRFKEKFGMSPREYRKVSNI